MDGSMGGWGIDGEMAGLGGEGLVGWMAGGVVDNAEVKDEKMKLRMVWGGYNSCGWGDWWGDG